MQALANGLYKQAASLERTYALLGLVLGVGGAAFITLPSGLEGGAAIAVVALSAGLGLGIGLSLARPRAFLMRVEAQKLLCQLEIEANTRNTAGKVSQLLEATLR